MTLHSGWFQLSTDGDFVFDAELTRAVSESQAVRSRVDLWLEPMYRIHELVSWEGHQMQLQMQHTVVAHRRGG